MTSTKLRLRRLVVDNFAVVLLAALLLIGLGTAVTYGVYAGDQTQTEIRETTLYETSPSFTHGVTVQRENEVFAVGTRLDGRSQYYTRIGPVATGNYTLGYRAESGRIDVELSTSLVVRGVASDSGAVLWAQRRNLDTVSATGVAPGETVHIPYRVNVSDLTDRTTTITESLGGTAGEVQTFLRVRSQLDGTVAGTTVQRTIEDRLEISTTGGTFSLTPNATAVAGTINRPVMVTNPPGLLRAIGGPLALALGLLGGGGLVIGWRQGRLSVSESERELLTYRSQYDEFDEWITTGRIPEASGFDSGEAVRVSNLKGLVDVAIDTEARVIEDTATGRFVVEGPRRTYYFDPPNPEPRPNTDSVEPAIRRIE